MKKKFKDCKSPTEDYISYRVDGNNKIKQCISLLKKLNFVDTPGNLPLGRALCLKIISLLELMNGEIKMWGNNEQQTNTEVIDEINKIFGF